MKILVVEDEPVSSRLAKNILDTEGHTVALAADAEEAVAVLESESPAVILLDLMLPKMNGLDFARLLKRHPKTGRIPIIAITAYPERFSKKEVLEAGCDAYLIKPVKALELARSVQQAEELGRARGGTA